MVKSFRIILGDQLNPNHSWFKVINSEITYVFIECKGEGSYAPHHIQKVVGIFYSMRQFANTLKKQGHNVIYHKILESKEIELIDILDSICQKKGVQNLYFQHPDELRMLNNLKLLRTRGYHVSFSSTEHFISTPEDFHETFAGKKTYLMESFYRKLRKKTGILMQGNQPKGGKWNFDNLNRNKIPKDHLLQKPYLPSTDVTEVYQEIIKANLPTIGSIGDSKTFFWPTNTNQALAIFDYWLKHQFKFFGDYQDAMTVNDWSLYHSRISFALNTKMLDPYTICRRAESYFEENEHIPINAAEGFIRQILGWREYMRGIYWERMPKFSKENFFEHSKKLPDWFWNGETKMKCMEHSIKQSLKYAYAHHIQRLMVIGNFSLLAGVHPDQLDFWFLGIYIDAFQWVEITNTRGMSQYADGGWIATKPYVSSANYINKMGDYCQNCSYNYKTKTDSDSCPFNALYWDFFDRHRKKLFNNFRLGMVYRTYEKMKDAQKEELRERAQYIMQNLEAL